MQWADDLARYLGESPCASFPSIDEIEPTIHYRSPECHDRWNTVHEFDENKSILARDNGIDEEKNQEEAVVCIPLKKGRGKRSSADFDKSMYAVFFKQQQPIVKALHPHASFGQISQLIAAAWERVDIDQKKQFKVAAAAAKREEMRKRIALRAVQLGQGGGPSSQQ